MAYGPALLGSRAILPMTTRYQLKICKIA